MEKKSECRPGGLENVTDSSITWRWRVPVGHTLDDVQNPAYWRQVLRELGQARVHGQNPFNKIEIISEDGKWEALLRVLHISADGLVTTRLLSHWTDQRPGRKAIVPDGYKVEFVSPHGWRALDSRGGVVVEREPTEESALRAAGNHARKAA